MNTVAVGVLLVLGLVVLDQVQAGTLRQWFGAKFLNAGDPNRGPAAAAADRFDDGEPTSGWSGVFTDALAAGEWVRPVAGRVTSGFGPRTHPVTGRRSNHAGIDLAAPTGTPVSAARGGRVVRAGGAGGYGLLVELDHGDGVRTRYAHLSTIAGRSGDTVSAGRTIGAVGETGTATGPHLHLELRVNGEAIDPAPLLGGR